MKKNLLLVFALISTFGFSQVSLRKTTKTATTHFEETMNCSNGTNSYTISGLTNINIGNTDSWGAILGLLVPGNNNLIEFGGGQIINSTINPIQIGGISINWYNNSSFEWTEQTPTPSTNFANVNIKIIQKTSLANINGDYSNSTFGIDSKYMSWYIYDVLNVPINSVLILSTPQLRDGASGSILSSQAFYLRWTGTEWEHTTTLPNNIPDTAPILQEWDTNSLSISEIDNLKNKISIYPNPTNNFITIQNKENSSENFDYKIIDLTGRFVKSGNSKFNEKINIESLEIGNYIIQIQRDNNEIITQKIIKN